jgi:hypothetical protein
MTLFHGKLLGQAVLMLLQLLCVLALWNNDAPPFIYVAF